MNNKQFKSLCQKLGACEDGYQYIDGLSLAQAWKDCKRADWMLWLCGKMADKKGWPTQNEVVLASCSCAETSFKYLPKDEKRPQACIEVVRRYVRGEATMEELRAARTSSVAAASAAAYAASAASAFSCAASYAAASAASAFSCAASYGADAAASDARAKALAEMADIVREMLKVPEES